MSLQSANEFISVTTSSAELMAKVAEAITGKSPTDAAQAVSDLGRLNGFEFTAEDAMQARQEVLQSQKLSEDDLNGIAGGSGFQSKLGATPVGGGFVSPGINDTLPVGTFPSNETKPAGKITDIAAGW
jgi:predicted ribosomally synthesized peptide with nif11-like leader